MELADAVSLISKGIDAGVGQQQWADLGAGSGLFSQALASLLPAGSHILAIDKGYGRKPPVINHPAAISISTLAKDFNTDDIGITGYHGLLLANSLHFIRDKSILLEQLKTRLLPAGRILIIEYDSDRSNQWVPYPINFVQLEKLCAGIFENAIQKIAQHPSRYHSQGMYAALIIV